MNHETGPESPKRKLKLVDRFDNDDYSRYAAPDYVEQNFDIGVDDHDSRLSTSDEKAQVWNSGISGGERKKGPYYGKGPKGYLRKDERIYEDICELLMRHRQIDASEIIVGVDNGAVYLTGKVDSLRTKKLVQMLSRDVPGVREIDNELSVIKESEDDRGPIGVTKKDLGIT